MQPHASEAQEVSENAHAATWLGPPLRMRATSAEVQALHHEQDSSAGDLEHREQLILPHLAHRAVRRALWLRRDSDAEVDPLLSLVLRQIWDNTLLIVDTFRDVHGVNCVVVRTTFAANPQLRGALQLAATERHLYGRLEIGVAREAGCPVPSRHSQSPVADHAA